MAKLELKLKGNVDGEFYVDSTCIDCDACRKFSPAVFGDSDDYAYVKKQPQNPDEVLISHQALLSCPTGSIGTIHKPDLHLARESLPLRLAGDIFLNGFNARDSYGADSYFIQSPEGNWLVDSPRFTKALAEKFAAMGGLKYIFLTHRDDVADAALYARHFQARRIIHASDSAAQKDAELILRDETSVVIDKARMVHVPGHTEGHLVLLWDEKYLFTGDHFAWSRSRNQFAAFRDYCWYSWEEQIRSVAIMKEFEQVEWVLPGHGHRKSVARGSFPQIIENAVAWMRSV